MKIITLFHDKLEKLFLEVLVFQLVIMFLSSGLDYGNTFRINSVALFAYWLGAVLILIRRGQNPTAGDLVYFRWGFPFLVLMLNPLTWWFWHLRGLD